MDLAGRTINPPQQSFAIPTSYKRSRIKMKYWTYILNGGIIVSTKKCELHFFWTCLVQPKVRNKHHKRLSNARQLLCYIWFSKLGCMCKQSINFEYNFHKKMWSCNYCPHWKITKNLNKAFTNEQNFHKKMWSCNYCPHWKITKNLYSEQQFERANSSQGSNN